MIASNVSWGSFFLPYKVFIFSYAVAFFGFLPVYVSPSGEEAEFYGKWAGTDEGVGWKAGAGLGYFEVSQSWCVLPVYKGSEPAVSG